MHGQIGAACAARHARAWPCRSAIQALTADGCTLKLFAQQHRQRAWIICHRGSRTPPQQSAQRAAA